MNKTPLALGDFTLQLIEQASAAWFDNGYEYTSLMIDWLGYWKP